MESAPPLNLSTTVKVEDMKALVVPEMDTQDYTVEGELVEDVPPDDVDPLQMEGHEEPQDDTAADGVGELSPGGKDKEYKCGECKRTFSRASQLRSHERLHVEDHTYECDQCSQVFVRLGLLMVHRREHRKPYKPMKQQNFSCSECGAKFNLFNNYRIHMKKHKGDKGDKPFKCTDCNTAFSQQCHLTIHRRTHTGEKPYTCEVCQQGFKQVSHLNTHMRIHTQDKPFVCNLCNASFSQTSSLKRHKRRHTGEKPFKCDVCGAMFVERRNLARHKLTHTGEKPYKCEKCTASFTQMIDLKRHQMSHSGLKPFKCDICEAAFSRKNNLQWHKLTHEGDTPYKCERCNAGFSLNRDLKAHMRTHIGTKPFSCDQCDATFSQFSTLKRHQSSHTGERHYVCTKCNAAFKDKSALKRHQLRHQSVRPYNCAKCNASFVEYRNLKRHKVVVHGEDRFDGEEIPDLKEGENIQNIPPIKKRKQEGDVAIGQIFEANYVSDGLDSQHVGQAIAMPPTAPLPQSQPQMQVASPMPVPPPTPVVSEIVTIPAQAPGQMPTLMLTQPGQPPRPGRLANNCQNFQSHVMTYVEGSLGQWQSWCFCETPNIPSNQPNIIDNGSVNSHPPSSLPAASVAHQQVTYTDLQQPVAQQTQTNVGVQEVDQEYQQNPQYHSSYSQIITHYDDSSHTDHLDNIGQDPPQPHTQVHQHHEEAKLDTESQIFAMTGVPASNQPSPQQQLGTHHHQQPHNSQQLHHHQEQMPQQAQQEQHQRPAEPQMMQHEQEMVEQQLDPQVTFQYSLTVNNPATGDIQIQSEAFPANPPENTQESPTKKRRVGKPQDSQVNKVYACSSCPKEFTRINHLTIHQRRHTGEKPFQCGLCMQAFTHKNSLTIHMRGHTGERPYICPICGAAFTQKSNLRVHNRTHTGEKPFKCDMCDASFSQGSHLTAHKRIHNNDRPYVCDRCQQTFTQRSALKRHVMTHTGNKPHKCEDCNARFSQRDDLKRHQRVHANDKAVNINCQYKDCNLVLPDKSSLVKHIRACHYDKPEVVDEGKKRKKRKAVNKEDCSPPGSPKGAKESKPKANASTVSAHLEPTRVSKRIREAAQRKKDKPEEDSDFIIGDFVELDEIKESRPTVQLKQFKKEGDKAQDNRAKEKAKMETWCFCEVPHGPDEPHNHIAVDVKPKGDTENIATSNKTTRNPGDLIPSDDASGATSLLQLSMEHVTHDHLANNISEGLQVATNGALTMDGSSIVVEPSHLDTPGSQDVGGANEDGSAGVGGHIVATLGQPQGQTRLVGQQMITGQVVTGHLVNTNQLMTPEGAIYIEAGEMLSNGAVVINPAHGTFISYDQITLGGDGQVLGLPVGGSSGETLMIQPAGGSEGTSNSGTITYTTATQLPNTSAAQPIQYTTLGNDVISILGDKQVSVVAKPFDCSVCAKPFAQQRSLWPHMQEAHPELFSCFECCAAFTTEEFLNQHTAEQHQRAHSCARCGLRFSSKAALNKHRARKHSNIASDVNVEEKIFKCNQCDARFYQQCDLKRHTLGHTGEKPYRCKQCDAGFTRTSSLNKHMRIHTGEKPYVCEECDQAFSYRYQFNRHKVIHRQDQRNAVRVEAFELTE